MTSPAPQSRPAGLPPLDAAATEFEVRLRCADDGRRRRAVGALLRQQRRLRLPDRSVTSGAPRPRSLTAPGAGGEGGRLSDHGFVGGDADRTSVDEDHPRTAIVGDRGHPDLRL